MTMRFTDGFYLSDGNQSLKYDFVESGVSRVSLGTNSYGASTVFNSGGICVKDMSSAWASQTSPTFVGFRVKLGGASLPFFTLRSHRTSDTYGMGSGQLRYTVQLFVGTIASGNGTIVLKAANSTGTVTTYFTSGAVLSTTVYHYVEIGCYPLGGHGNDRVILKVDGTVLYDSFVSGDIDFGGGDFSGTPLDQILVHGEFGLSNAGCTIADLYVCDGGGTTNNNFLGDTKIETLLPNADGTTQQFALTPKNLLRSVNEASLETDVSAWFVDNSSTPVRHTSGGPGALAGAGPEYASTQATNGVTSRVTTATGTAGIPVVAGRTYTLSLDYAVDSLSASGSWSGLVRWYSSAGSLLSESSFGLSQNTTWTRTAGAVTAPTSAAYAAVGLIVTPSGANPVVYWDAVMLSEGDMTAVTGGTTYVDPSTSHYAAVSEASEDQDGSYVRSGTSGQIETFKYPALASASGLVAALNFTPVIRRESVGPNSVLPCMLTRGLASYIQNKSTWQTASSASLVSLTSPTQAGDCVVIFCLSGSSSFTALSASGLGATWVTGPFVSNGTAGVYMGAMIGYNCSAGLTDITITPTIGTAEHLMTAYVFRGLKSSGTPVVASTSNFSATTDSVPIALTLTPTFPNQLMVVGFGILTNPNNSQFMSIDGSPVPFALSSITASSSYNMEAGYATATSTVTDSISVHDNWSGAGAAIGLLLDPAFVDASGSASVAFAQDTSYHAGLDIVETNPVATSRALTIAEVNAGELGFIVP